MVTAWNLMGRYLDWAALPVVVEILGVEDVESFIVQLVALRDRKQD